MTVIHSKSLRARPDNFKPYNASVGRALGCIKLGSVNATKAPGSLGRGDLPLVVVLVVVIVIENLGDKTEDDYEDDDEDDSGKPKDRPVILA